MAMRAGHTHVIPRNIYGLTLHDGKFRIRDNDTGIHKHARPRVAETLPRPDLINIMWEIGVHLPNRVSHKYIRENNEEIVVKLLHRRINKTREEILAWSNDRKEFYFVWYSATHINRRIICEIIRNRMIQIGLYLDY